MIHDACLDELRCLADPLVGPPGGGGSRLGDKLDQGPLDGDDHEDDSDTGNRGDKTKFEGYHEENLRG